MSTNLTKTFKKRTTRFTKINSNLLSLSVQKEARNLTPMKRHLVSSDRWALMVALIVPQVCIQSGWTQTVTEPLKAISHATQSNNKSSPECNFPAAPNFCKWDKERLIQAENDRVTTMGAQFTSALSTIKIKKLLGGSYLPGADPEYAAFCNAALKRVQERNFELFPRPNVQSSADGYQAYGEKWLEIAKKQQCDEGEINQARKYAAGVSTTYQAKGYTQWLYENSFGYTKVFINHLFPQTSASSSMYRCKHGHSVQSPDLNKKIFNSSFAVMNLNGKMFLAEIGIRHWVGNEFKFDPYTQLLSVDVPENNLCDDTGHCKAKFLSLFPVDAPPWETLLKRRAPSVRHKEFYGRVDQVCLWWIG